MCWRILTAVEVSAVAVFCLSLAITPAPVEGDAGASSRPSRPGSAAAAQRSAHRGSASMASVTPPSTAPESGQPTTQDRDAYDRTRVFATASSGAEAPLLRAVGISASRLGRGDSSTLAVAAVPAGLVTFTSFGLGAFANGSTSITIAADDDGIARAVFTATPGTVDGVDILVGCAQTSGNVAYHLDIQ